MFGSIVRYYFSGHGGFAALDRNAVNNHFNKNLTPNKKVDR
jgi:hypothetical protein